MDQGNEGVAERGEVGVAEQKAPSEPRSLAIAQRGIRTSGDVRDMMSSLMSDVISGSVTPEVTNAACNACGKLIKMVELEYKFGTEPKRPARELSVAFDEDLNGRTEISDKVPGVTPG